VSEAVYLETSALLAWLLGEPEGDAVRREVDAAALVVTSRLTLVEAERGLLRAEGEGRISPAERHTLVGVLAGARAGWFRLALSEAICERAGKPFPVEPVRTPDGLHLASALTALEAYPDLRVLTLDDRVTKNARGLGLAVASLQP
jgi:predicted nucleic acid-binding protein